MFIQKPDMTNYRMTMQNNHNPHSSACNNLYKFYNQEHQVLPWIYILHCKPNHQNCMMITAALKICIFSTSMKITMIVTNQHCHPLHLLLLLHRHHHPILAFGTRSWPSLQLVLCVVDYPSLQIRI